MRQIIITIALLLSAFSAKADAGSRAWLTQPTDAKAQVTCKLKDKTAQIAAQELADGWTGKPVTLKLIKDKALGNEGYRVTNSDKSVTVEAVTSRGLLYAAYDMLRRQGSGMELSTCQETPAMPVRMLNHWDNLDGSIERGYAGKSIFWGVGKTDAASVTDADRKKWKEYARLCASIGINATVLNNVNASPKMLSAEVLGRVKEIADVLRPYGITSYISINFSSPAQLDGLKTSDPLDSEVQKWWKDKADEIYRLIPDFGGFLVKANSEGLPGPQDFGRTHAEGANMIAAALRPHGGRVFWRAFVYSPEGNDRAKQAYDEFKPQDNDFDKGISVQVKNGPVDFQPLEPYSPLFGQMKHTPLTAELQITMEYLGQERWLTYLAPQWKHFFDECGLVKNEKLKVKNEKWAAPFDYIAGVSNIGDDANWCGSIFNQANFYAFGRLAWNPDLTAEDIAKEWVSQTFRIEDLGLKHEKKSSIQVPKSSIQNPKSSITAMMLQSWRNTLNAMMPLGLHHIFAADHHYGPEPWCNPPGWRIDWTPPYYHKADKAGVGFDRTIATGTKAVAQYPQPFAQEVGNLATCPYDYLLWFHHLPWDYKLGNGRTLWQEMCRRYDLGLQGIRGYQATWQKLQGEIDPEMHESVTYRLRQQLHDVTLWHDACILYFQSINGLPLPEGTEPPQYNLKDLVKPYRR